MMYSPYKRGGGNKSPQNNAAPSFLDEIAGNSNLSPLGRYLLKVMQGGQSGPNYVPGQMSNDARKYADELVSRYYGLKPGKGPVSNYEGTVASQYQPFTQGASGIDYSNYSRSCSNCRGDSATSIHSGCL